MAEIDKRESTTPERDWWGRWFDDWSPRWPEMWRGFLPEMRERLLEGGQALRVEEFEDGNTLVVRAEMPGIDPDKDVEINVADHTLRIRAERRQEAKTEEKGGYRSEFSYGSFRRTLPLPAGATDQDVKASYKDGILEIRVPIDRGEAEARKIPVERT